MIEPCRDEDLESIYEVVNDGAEPYCGTIPLDCWREPYMSRHELRGEVDHQVRFWGFRAGGPLLGVRGTQQVGEVVLIPAGVPHSLEADSNQHWSSSFLGHLQWR